MNKLKKLLSVVIVFGVCVCLTSCNNDKKYLENTHSAYNDINVRMNVCYEILSNYSVILSAPFAQWASPETLDRSFFKVYGQMYGNRSDKIQMLDSKSLDGSMAKLRNPPKKYESTYNKMLELYGAYTKIQRIVVKAEGSEVRNSLKQIKQTLEDFNMYKDQLNVMLKE